MAKETTAKQKEKKPKKRGRIRETFGELKKVTWPSFATVVKQTGVVLAIVLVFLVVLMGFDTLLGWLYGVLVQGLNGGSAASVTGLMTALSSNVGACLPLCL